MTGEADNGAAGGDLAHVLDGAIVVVAVDAGFYPAGIEGDFVVLGGVWIQRVNDSVTVLAVARAGAGAAFQYAGCGGVAGVAIVLMDIDE